MMACRHTVVIGALLRRLTSAIPAARIGSSNPLPATERPLAFSSANTRRAILTNQLRRAFCERGRFPV